MEATKSMKKITVKVGEKPEDGSDDETKYEEYAVPGKILASKSPFFQTCLKPEWIERSGRVISLPDHLPAAFEIYLRWINSHEVLVGFDESGPNGLEALVQASILGDPLQDNDFRDAIADAIIEFLLMQKVHMFKYLRHIYENTIKDDPLREIALDSCVYEAGLDWVYDGYHIQHENRVSRETMWDLICTCNRRALANFTTFRSRVRANWCMYHMHNEEQCYKLKRKYRGGVVVLPEEEDN